MLDIEFEEHEVAFKNMAMTFDLMGEKALYKTHYALASETEFEAEDWKTFLMDPRVNAKIQEEMRIIEGIKRRALMQDIDTTKSPGKAALVKTMMDKEDKQKAKKKEGPIVIYTYIPLNSEEKHASNTRELTVDPFEVEI